MPSSSTGVLSSPGVDVSELSGSTIVPSHPKNIGGPKGIWGGDGSVVELVGDIQKHLAPDLWITDAQLHRHYDEKSVALDALFNARCDKVEKYWKGQMEAISTELNSEKAEHTSTKISLKLAEESLKKVRHQAATSAGSLKISQEAQAGTIRRLEARAAELEDAFLDSQRSLNVYEVALLGLVDKRRNESRVSQLSRGGESGTKSPGRRRRSLAPSAILLVPEINNVGLVGGFPQRQPHLLSSSSMCSSPSFSSPTSPQQHQGSIVPSPLSVSPSGGWGGAVGGGQVLFSEDDLLSADDIVAVIRKQRALIDGKLQSLQAEHLLLTDENEDLNNKVSILESDVKFLQARLKESATSKTTGSGSNQRGVGGTMRHSRASVSVASRGGGTASAAGGGLRIASSPSGMSIGGRSIQSTSAHTTSTIVPSAPSPSVLNSNPMIDTTASSSGTADSNGLIKTEVRMVPYESASTMANDCRRRRLEVIEGVERLVGELEAKIVGVKPLGVLRDGSRKQQQDGGSSAGGDQSGGVDDAVSIHAPPETPTLTDLTHISTLAKNSTASTSSPQNNGSKELEAFTSFQVLVDLHRQIQRKDNQIQKLQTQLEAYQQAADAATSISKRQDVASAQLFQYKFASSRPESARTHKAAAAGHLQSAISSPPHTPLAATRPTSAATQGRFTPIKVST